MLMKEYVEKVKEVINRGWTQGYYAYDSFDSMISTHSPHAVKRCFVGAMYFVDKLNDTEQLHLCLEDLLSDKYNIPQIAVWNDTPGRTKEEVLNLLDEVIQSC